VGAIVQIKRNGSGLKPLTTDFTEVCWESRGEIDKVRNYESKQLALKDGPAVIRKEGRLGWFGYVTCSVDA